MESLDKFCEAGFEISSKDGSISKHRCLSVVGHGTSDRLWEMSFSSLRKKDVY